jgi:hypothetical protein
MTIVQQMASFIHHAAFDELSGMAREQIKIRVLDSLGAAIGALGSGPVRSVRAHIDDFGRSAQCSLIGGGQGVPGFCRPVQQCPGSIPGFQRQLPGCRGNLPSQRQHRRDNGRR